MSIRRSVTLIVSVLVLTPILTAYAQWALFGLPSVPIELRFTNPSITTSGFPAWVNITHYVNLFFLIVLVRSGLQILFDHPRLYWNIHCTPGTEWVRFTPIKVPMDRLWTAKDDTRYLTPLIGLPGGRHTLGLARHWHFLSVLFWVLNGAVFITLLFVTDHWRRLVPTSWMIFPNAWSTFVHYVTFHPFHDPNGFYQYNALQQLSYFGVVFVLAPLAIITGPSMSPALDNRFSWYPRMPGNRQIGRSLHFIVMIGFCVFTLIHVALVAGTGLVRNMNHIVLGRDDLAAGGIILGAAGLAVMIAANVLANRASHKSPRRVQKLGEMVLNPVTGFLLDRHSPRAEYRRDQISPFFWVNGKMPVRDDWKMMMMNEFKDYRLRIHGLVENSVELSLADLRALGEKTQVTLHHCIQGWSGIAAWTGIPMEKVIELVKPRPEARFVVFYSFGEGGEGGQFYDSHSIENSMHSQTMLAYGMNDRPLSDLHGAPLRLRVENQLGYKMVKWIEAIEFVEDMKPIFKGAGGYNEDNEFFGSMANI
jgi:sulfoxide reductase catalytic subunit YedY